MNVELYINNTLVEVDNTVEWNITKTFSDIENPTAIFADYSKTITIPATANNNKIFGNLFSIDRITAENENNNTGIFFNPLKKADCKLLLNGELILAGYAKITEATKDSYTINIIGALGKVFNELGKYKFTSNFNDPYFINYLPAYYYQLTPQTIAKGLTNYQNPTKNSFTDCFGFYKAFSGHEDNVDESSYLVEYNSNEINTFTNTLATKFGGSNLDNYRDILNKNLKNGLYWYEFQNQIKDITVLPYVYCNKMIECYKHLVDTTTDYTLELDKDFFNFQNPFYKDYVYTLPKLSENLNNTKSIISNKSNFYVNWLYNQLAFFVSSNETNFSKTVYLDFTPKYDIYKIQDEYQKYKFNLTEYYKLFEIVNTDIKVKTGFSFSSIRLKDKVSGFNGCPVRLYKGYILTTLEITYLSGVKDIFKILYYNDAEDNTNTFDVEADFYYNLKNTDLFIFSDSVQQYEINLPVLSLNIPLKETQFEITVNYTLYGEDAFIRVYKNNSYLIMNDCYVNVLNLNVDLNFKGTSSGLFSITNIFNKDFYLQNWVIDYTKKFGLVWLIDYLNKKIYIKTKDNYFKECKVEKLDDFITDIKVLTSSTPYSKYIFKFKDSDTNNAIEYKKEVGLDYGYLEINTDNELDTEEKVVFDNENNNIVTKINGRNWNRIYNNENYNYTETVYFLPALFKGDIITDYKPVNPENRYFFRGLNFDNITSFIIQTLNTEVEQKKYYYLSVNNNTPETILKDINQLPKLTPVSSELDYKFWATYSVPVYDFAGLDTSITDTIYSAFWENWLNFITNKKVIKVKAILKDDNIQKFYSIGNNLFVVNKISNYNYTSKEAEVELQQINNALPSFNPTFRGLYIQLPTVVATYTADFTPVEFVILDINTETYTISVPTAFYSNFLLEIDNEQYTTDTITLGSGTHTIKVTALQGNTNVSFALDIATDTDNKEITIKNY